MCKLHRGNVPKRFEHGVGDSVGEVVGGDHVLLVNASLADVDFTIERFETANDTDMSQETEMVSTRVTYVQRRSGMATTY
jgi:hypothetical protein